MASGTSSIARKRLPHTEAVRDRALADFAAANPDLRFAPVVAVIAALDEEGALGQVLAEVPAQACGLDVDVLVIDDGSTDRTSEVASEGGAYVARLERNCGHGVALRAGYRLAREFGARFVVTLDGDGQWNPSELAGVLEPVVRDEADFVIGSRVLGATETDDAFRQTGVHVFGWLVRLLTGGTVTDTSSGFRAMRVEVTETVRQEQVQYQTSELLIGALLGGYRVTERPITMRKRLAGESKKGHNVLYGLRYAGVILQTWQRERPTASVPPSRRGAIEPLLAALRATRLVLAVALVVIVGVLAARDVTLRGLTWGWLAPALALTVAWWVLLARTWAILVGGRIDRADLGRWCRTQVLRYLPGGIWAPTSRVALTPGTALDRFSTVAAENVVSLCAALALGGVAMAAAGRPGWAPLVLVLAAPVLGARALADRTRLDTARVLRAQANGLVGFACFAAAAVLVQGAISGWHDALLVAGAAGISWAAGLVVVFAPGGVGARELVYIWLLGGAFGHRDLVTAAIAMRLVTMAAELLVLVVLGRDDPSLGSADPQPAPAGIRAVGEELAS